MKEEFWISRWKEGRIGFHEGRPNALLARHVARLGEHRRVLVPLCGKSEDLAHLASQGHEVVGVELVEDAVRAFFSEHDLEPTVEELGAAKRFRSGALTVFAGDFFALTKQDVGAVDALYDRAAMIAMPDELRTRYVQQVRRLLEPESVGLVVTLEYPREAMNGPPFSISEEALRRQYAGCEIERLETVDATGPKMREAGVEASEHLFVIRGVSPA